MTIERDHGWHSVCLLAKKTASGQVLFDTIATPGWATEMLNDVESARPVGPSIANAFKAKFEQGK